MTAPRQYKLTEEVARQAVEVIFNNTQEWFICFSNPTAGPWKLIKLFTASGPKEVDRFLKEDTRPDVILQNYSKGIFILLEAKDDVKQLLNAKQVEKSTRMFQAEIRRLASLISMHEGKGSERRYVFLTGFLYPSTNHAENLKTFDKVYHTFLKGRVSSDFEIDHYITFLVEQKRNLDLFVSWHIAPLKGDSSQIISKLLETFPKELTQYVPKK